MAAPTEPRSAAASRPSAVRRNLHRAAFPPRLAARWLTAGRRARPEFLVIGAQKAGTTSLYAQVCTHPAVAPALRKEVH